MINISIAYIGVPLNVLVACAIGAFCSFSFGERVTPRRQMWGIYVACVLMGAALTAITNAAIGHFMDVEMTAGLHAGLGTVVSFLARFFIPWLVDVVQKGKWLSWIPWIRSDKQ